MIFWEKSLKIFLWKCRMQFWKTCRKNFVRSQNSFRSNKESRCKNNFIVKKSSQRSSGHAECIFDNRTEKFLSELCEMWNQNCFEEKHVVFSKAPPDMYNTILTTLMELLRQRKSKTFRTKSENESEFIIFSQKSVIWFSRIFFCTPKFSRQFHTLAEVFFCGESETLLHEVQKWVWIYKFQRKSTLFQKILPHMQTSIAVSTMLPKVFCWKSDYFPPVVQKLV